MRVHRASDLHRQIEKLPKVERFLSSLKRNSINTSNGYKTPITYFHEFLLSNYNQSADSIIQLLVNNEIDVYSLLDEFIGFVQTKRVNSSSINQYLTGIRSYLSYYDVDIVPAKFKKRVRIPKIYHEEEEPIDAKDIRQMLLNCHNRRLKAFILVLASSGLRASEACALRLCDVDFTVLPTKIHVRKEYAKTRVSRDVWMSDEATKYLRDWLVFKHGNDILTIFDTNGNDNIHGNAKNRNRLLQSLIFQVQQNNDHVTPKSLYLKMLIQFQKLLEIVGFGERKERMVRRKITFHSYRRFVKTILSDNVGKEYSEWYLGHAKSGYYVSKPEVRASTYVEKAMKYLTFLDYYTLEETSKSIESKLSEKEKEIQMLRQKDATNTDAISALSDQLSYIMKEVELLKQVKI
jgi:integrase